MGAVGKQTWLFATLLDTLKMPLAKPLALPAISVIVDRDLLMHLKMLLVGQRRTRLRLQMWARRLRDVAS